MRDRSTIWAVASALACLTVLAACESDEERAAGLLADARRDVEAGTADDETLATLERAVAIDGSLVEAWRLLTRLRLDADRYSEAADAAERTLALTSVRPSADDVSSLARARAGAHEWTAARDAYRRALALDPSRHALHAALGRTLEHLGERGDAEGEYLAALDGDETLVEPRLRLGAMRLEELRQDSVGEALDGDPDEALRRLMAREATRRSAHYFLDTVLARLDESDPRAAALEAYLAELARFDARDEEAMAAAREQRDAMSRARVAESDAIRSEDERRRRAEAAEVARRAVADVNGAFEQMLGGAPGAEDGR